MTDAESSARALVALADVPHDRDQWLRHAKKTLAALADDVKWLRGLLQVAQDLEVKRVALIHKMGEVHAEAIAERDAYRAMFCDLVSAVKASGAAEVPSARAAEIHGETPPTETRLAETHARACDLLKHGPATKEPTK